MLAKRFLSFPVFLFRFNTFPLHLLLIVPVIASPDFQLLFFSTLDWLGSSTAGGAMSDTSTLLGCVTNLELTRRWQSPENDCWSYLQHQHTHTHAHLKRETFRASNQSTVKSACGGIARIVNNSDTCRHAQKYIFFVIFLLFFFCPPLHLSPPPSSSLHLYLDRSLSSHQDTNQDFPAAGPGSLVKELEKKREMSYYR